MRISIDTNDLQFLRRLRRMGTATIQEICDEVGVTATAVRQRLSRLQGLGLVSRELVRTGRGRPHHTYTVTDDGLKELGENYADLTVILWRTINSIEEPELRASIVGRVEEELVNRFGRFVRGETLQQRVSELKQALVDRGFDVEVDACGPLPILRENNCPYPELASGDPAICDLEQSVFQRVLGADVRLTRCCRDGDHCCEFQANEHKD